MKDRGHVSHSVLLAAVLIGADTRTGVALAEYRYDPPFRFTGKIDRLAVALR